MAILEYPVFYRKYGVRFMESLSKPQRHSITKLELPKHSLWHYVSDTDTATGPEVDEPPLRFSTKVIMVEHVTALERIRGNPRPTMLPTGPMIRAYHLRYRRTRPLRSLGTTEKDPMTLVVENYALLSHTHRYMASVFSKYNEWYNIQSTVFKRMADLTVESERHQFLQIVLPQRLPTFDFLRMMEKQADPDKRLVDKVDESSGWLLLEFWKWLGEYRELSLFNKIPTESLSKINIVWQESGSWIVTNLGTLDEWRTKFIDKDSQRIQRLWLRSIIHLLAARSVAVDTDTDDTADQDGESTDQDSSNDTDNTKDTDVKYGSRDSSRQDAVDDIERELSNLPEVDLDEIIEDIDDSELFGTDVDTDIVPVTDKPDTDTVKESRRVAKLTTDDDVAELQDLSTAVAKAHSETTYVGYTPKVTTPLAAVSGVAAEYAEKGMITPPEYRQILKSAERYTTLQDPFGGKDRLVDAMVTPPELLAIPETTPIVGDIPGVTDQSMLNSSLERFDSHYVTEVLDKHVMQSVVGIQAAGISVTDYRVEPVNNLTDNYLVHTVKVSPVIGKSSTLKFKTPVVDRSGNFKVNGNKLRLRKQRGDLPIRKVSPSRVALTSYYSKVFVDRTERRANNYDHWIMNQLRSIAFKPESPISDIRLGDAFDNALKLPRIYSTIAQSVVGWEYRKAKFSWDYHRRIELWGDAVTTVEAKHGMVVVGHGTNTWWLLDDHSVFYQTTSGGALVEVGTLEVLIGIDAAAAPITYAEIGIMGKTIPLGVVMGSMVGLGVLLKTLNVTPRRVKTGRGKTGTGVNVQREEFAVRFSDESLIFPRTPQNMLIFSGFNRYHRDVRRFSVYEFDRVNVYTAIFEKNNIGARYGRELKLMDKLWCDPITRSVLEEMQEPTDLIGLFIRSVELLMTDWHPDLLDMAYMRDKGYERIAGNVYTEMCRAVRLYNARPVSRKISVGLNPEAVWQSLLQDPAIQLVEDSNPIHNLKEKEVVIFGGKGGRSSRSMTEPTRRYHRSAMGVVSEATVDNSDVGAVTFLTADPNYTSVLGFTRRADADAGAGKLVSTSMLLTPGADRDDAKRAGFISIQNSQTMAASGYTSMPTRTGYERVLAHRVDPLYATTAKQVGKVTALDSDVITVTYADGSTETTELGRQYGVSAGTVIPHALKTDQRLGAAVAVGDVVAYNSNFFTPDSLYPNQVLYKSGVLARTVLWESPDTLEDSSAVSLALSKRLSAEITQIRTIKLAFDQEIRGLVRQGTEIGVESILCTIENSTESSGELFDADSLATLRVLSNLTPRAKYAGQVERIEVLYRGDIDDMSESLSELTRISDRSRSRLNRKRGEGAQTGAIDPTLRVDGAVLEPNSVAIQVYITGLVPFNTGDKGVFGAQLKTTVGRVMTGVDQTESGLPIDAIFGYRSENDRIVESAMLMGTTNSLLVVMGQRALRAYRQK